MTTPGARPAARPTNPNTASYWNGVYRSEWQRGAAEGGSRDYGPIHDAVVDLVADGSRVLDVGSGPGLLCRKLAERRPRASVLGVDFAGYAVEQARARDAELGVRYVCLDVRDDLRSLPGPFDVVTMCELLEHLEEPEKVVADAMALLRNGGLFALTCPHDGAVPDPEHLRLWGHDEVFHLLAPYARSVTFVHFAPPYFDAWLLAHLHKGG